MGCLPFFTVFAATVGRQAAVETGGGGSSNVDYSRLHDDAVACMSFKAYSIPSHTIAAIAPMPFTGDVSDSTAVRQASTLLSNTLHEAERNSLQAALLAARPRQCTASARGGQVTMG